MVGAEAAFNKSLEIDRNFGETHGGLAVIALLRGARAEAERLAEISLRLDRQSFAGHFAQSLLLAQQGKEAVAQEIVGKMLDSAMPGGQSLRAQLATLAQKKAGRRPTQGNQ